MSNSRFMAVVTLHSPPAVAAPSRASSGPAPSRHTARRADLDWAYFGRFGVMIARQPMLDLLG